jgi:hypothetical protein
VVKETVKKSKVSQVQPVNATYNSLVFAVHRYMVMPGNIPGKIAIAGG